MIYVNKNEVSENDFLSLLDKTKVKLESLLQTKERPKAMNGVEFENMVYANMVTEAVGSDFDGYIEQTGAHAFPDIVAKKFYGVEVKMTIGEKWVSTGNSILETTRIESVKTIYLFFGKFGNLFEVKYRKYQECLYEVGVTHSPRYKIDMNLSENKSIFDKLGIQYDIFRNDPNPIKILKDYYRKQLKEGEELWWIDAQVEDVSVSPVIRSFRKLSDEERRRFVVEAMILFPEMFGSSTLKFERAAAYLITAYNSVSSNLRDIFTAGGQETVTIQGKDVTLPKIYHNLLIEAKNIQNVIKEINDDVLTNYWRLAKTPESRMEYWKELLLEQAGWKKDGFDVLSVFEEGLK
ncbi:MAG: hypothetical protein KGI50_01540 [Patescibacteria group bacterium]|nr:hypothetical protein [Patescibacteria group bacterium]MDE2437974.1 hypothetical protein [Patescibacteria group bacterium]